LAEALPCATLSRALDEPMYGTASRVRGWVLLEQPGPWGFEAVLESRLDRDLAVALEQATRAAGVRLLLIRRPGRGASQPFRCFLVHTGRRDRWVEHRLELATVAAGQRPGFGEPFGDPLYLVCTNGKHDRCCATYGRPLALALHAAFGEQVWESSHVGGDRFAGNLVCLPDGRYFGRVGPEDARRVVALHRQGSIDLDHYRGRCSDPPTVQAAEWFARRQTGLLGLDDLTVEGRDRLGNGVDAVRFRGPGDLRLRVAVRATTNADPRFLTCHSARAEPPLRFSLLELAGAPGS
jgi:(2Fe-2S) ferredoxin